MILLDTNVVSELMRATPDPGVRQWLDDQVASEVWLSSISVGEIRLGIALLPEGRRRRQLAELAEAMFREDFAERCLPYDLAASAEYADIVAALKRRGRPISVEDAQIAAIARSAALTIATRNTRHFAVIDGVSLVNPWA